MEKKNIFIDSNVFLSFYGFTKDDLEELKKLVVLLKEEKVCLYLPEHVIEEVERNRESRIAEALKKFREHNFSLNLPQICKNYEEYEKMVELQKEISKLHDQLLNKMMEDIKKHSLKADGVIKELFSLSQRLATDDEEIYRKAYSRAELKCPPRKLGDCIIWEVLLKKVPDNEDLYFITADNDFTSPINKEEFHGYLLKEWKQKKQSNLIFYKSLSSFFRDYFPDIRLATELEKEILIDKLIRSESFRETHRIIAKLRKFEDFTKEQRNVIVEAAITNNQISWIIEDEDVKSFLLDIIKGHENEIEAGNLKRLKQLLALSELFEIENQWEDEDDDLPF